MKQTVVFVFFIILSLIFCGCSNSEVYSGEVSIELESTSESILDIIEDDNISETIADADNVSIEIEVNRNEFLHKDFKYNANEEFCLDLNNDNERDYILYHTTPIDEYDWEGHLIVNGVDFSDRIKLENPLTEYFFILDVDDEDDYYEIVVSTFGFSDDLESQWFRYTGTDLICLGTTHMIPNEGIYFGNDKTFTIHDRTYIFETNFIPVRYEIRNNKIEKLEDDLYVFALPRYEKLTTNVDLTVFEKRNTNSNNIIINKGEQIDSTLTDNIEWVNILYNEKEYWLHIVDNHLVENENIFIADAINNLILAD